MITDLTKTFELKVEPVEARLERGSKKDFFTERPEMYHTIHINGREYEVTESTWKELFDILDKRK